MFTIELVVADTDVLYLQALTKYLITYDQVTFLIHRFSDADSLHEFITNNEHIYYLLGQDMYLEISSRYSVTDLPHFAILVDDLVESHLNQYHLIGKYQKGGQIASQISKWFAETSSLEIPKVASQATKLISINQFQHNCDSVGHIISKYILKFYQRVLYISFDILSDVPNFLTVQESNNLSDLLYYVKKNITKLGMMVESIKSTDETGCFDYIPSCLIGKHLYEMDEQEMKAFISYLKDYLDYDIIILELDGHYNSQTECLMNQCDYNIIVRANQNRIQQRIHRFMRQPGIEKLDNVISMMIQHTEYESDIGPSCHDDSSTRISFPYNNNSFIDDGSLEEMFQIFVNEVIL